MLSVKAMKALNSIKENMAIEIIPNLEDNCRKHLLQLVTYKNNDMLHHVVITYYTKTFIVFILILRFVPSLQSVVCILYLVCSLPSSVCSLHFVLHVTG